MFTFLAYPFCTLTFAGVFVMVFSRAQTLGGSIAALMTFSLFVQGAEGSTFGIVPYLNPSVTVSTLSIINFIHPPEVLIVLSIVVHLMHTAGYGRGHSWGRRKCRCRNF